MRVRTPLSESRDSGAVQAARKLARKQRWRKGGIQYRRAPNSCSRGLNRAGGRLRVQSGRATDRLSDDWPGSRAGRGDGWRRVHWKFHQQRMGGARWRRSWTWLGLLTNKYVTDNERQAYAE